MLPTFCRFEEALVNGAPPSLSEERGFVSDFAGAAGVFLLAFAFCFEDAAADAAAAAAAPAARPATVFGIGQHFARPSSQICEGTQSE